MVWAEATHFNFPRKILRVLCRYFEHQRRVQFEMEWPAPSHSVARRVQRGYEGVSALKVEDFRGRQGALMEGRTRELAGIAEDRLQLSITGGGKQGTSKVVASCSCLKEKFQECRKKDGVGLATSVENVRSGPQDENEAAGSRGESKKEKVQREFFFLPEEIESSRRITRLV